MASRELCWAECGWFRMSSPNSLSQQVGPEKLADWVERLKKGGVQSLIAEFNAIKGEKLAGTTTVFEQNTPLNRYGNITLLDNTRVILNDDLPQKYIHASYVDGFNQPKEYVIGQAPPIAAIVDYWRMVWQERITLIVVLTSLKERGNPKADIFFPPEVPRPFRAGPFRILAQTMHPLPGQHRVVVARQHLRVWFAKKIPERKLIMLYYGNWPDTAVPQDTAKFLEFVRSVKTFEAWSKKDAPRGTSPPSLVHCSAGVGRSATLVACRIAVDQLEATGQIDIAGMVRRMRKQRALAVQNYLQYIFIHLLVAEAAKQRLSAQQ